MSDRIDLDEMERLAREATPDPYFSAIDDATDAPDHRDSGLMLVDTGRVGDWPIARLIEAPQARFTEAVTPEAVLALIAVARAAQAYEASYDDDSPIAPAPAFAKLREALSAFTPSPVET